MTKEVSDEARKIFSDNLKKLWKDPEFRQKIIDCKKKKSYRKQRSKIAKKLWGTFRTRKKIIRGMCESWDDNEERKKAFAERMRKANSSEKKKKIKIDNKVYKIVKKPRIRNYGGVVEDSSLRNE